MASPQLQYRRDETAHTALENIDFARGMMIAAGIGTDEQHTCLADSLDALKHLVAGAQLMLDNEDCGGSCWWDGWKTIRAVLTKQEGPEPRRPG